MTEERQPKGQRPRPPKAPSKDQSKDQSSDQTAEGATEQGSLQATEQASGRSNGHREGTHEGLQNERLLDIYRTQIVPTMMRDFSWENSMRVPRLEKIVLNIGMGEALQNGRAIEAASKDLATICGQRPVVTKARKSIAAFKLREGAQIGIMVTLRGQRMYAFLDKLINVALPRVRDFTGVSPKSFDGRGNYTLGLKEQLVFPEIEYDKVDRIRGLAVCIVTNARNDEEARHLLKLFGMPFRTSAQAT